MCMHWVQSSSARSTCPCIFWVEVFLLWQYFRWFFDSFIWHFISVLVVIQREAVWKKTNSLRGKKVQALIQTLYLSWKYPTFLNELSISPTVGWNIQKSAIPPTVFRLWLGPAGSVGLGSVGSVSGVRWVFDYFTMLSLEVERKSTGGSVERESTYGSCLGISV